MTHRVFGITGWKNSGKTTLTVRLVSELSARGYKVSTIKHAHHAFDIDREGADSYRHREAGAGEVAIVSGVRWALMHENRGEHEPPIEEILERLEPCDIVIVEGYKREDHPKIEARRKGTKDDQPLSNSDPAIIAIASDYEVTGESLPLFDIDDITRIADFIELKSGLKEQAA